MWSSFISFSMPVYPGAFTKTPGLLFFVRATAIARETDIGTPC